MVTTPLRIGVLGTHSTGKTQLLKRIESELRGHGLTVARTGRLGKRAASLGLPKMQHHTSISTEWIITQGVADELAAVAGGAHAVLADRAAFDAVAYYLAALEYRGEDPDPLECERLRLLAATQAPQYDLLLATVLDPGIAVEQSHSYDPRYRALVDQHIHALLAEEKLEHLTVTGTSQTGAVRHAVRAALMAVATR